MRGLRRNMAKLYDEICRTLATPMPRSRALKLIFGGLAGAVLAPFGFGQQACDPGSEPCPGVFPNGGGVQGCCPPGQHCCPLNSDPNINTTVVHCCSGPQSCCGNTCCTPSQHCENGACVANPTERRP